MEHLIRKSNTLIRDQSLHMRRSLLGKIDWSDRLIGILGARGTGKTTLMLQRLKQEHGPGTTGIYVSLDDIYFTENRLVDFAENFQQQGGRTLFLDEVHKYPDWAREIKNIYDFHKDLRIVFTGSSVIDLLRQNVDLSRRAVQYGMAGLSYREFLRFSNLADFDILALEDVLKHHTEIALDLSTDFKPLQYFNDYLRYGYYPFFIENINTYFIRVEQIIRLIIETDLQFVQGLNSQNIRKINQLLYILATNVPFKPNISKLSERIGVHRNTLVQYLHYLEQARLINTLSAAGKSISTLQKPEKIFLENTNLHYALDSKNADKGSMRESFFLNQLRNAGHEIDLPLKGDFVIDSQFTFEVGGKGKTYAQIKDLKQAFIAADNIESGTMNKIPLWLFGLLY